MAASNGRKTTSSNRKTTSSKTTSKSTRTAAKTGSRSKTATRKKQDAYQAAQDSALFHEIGLIVLFAVMVLLFCCNFGIIGPVGNTISGVMFGLFGWTAYAAPVLLFLAVAFWFANEGNPNALRKLISGIVLFVMAGIIGDLIAGNSAEMSAYNAAMLYESCVNGKNGGGILGGSLSYVLQKYLETIGAVLVVILCSVISLILLTEKSLLSSMKNGGARVKEFYGEDVQRRREYAEIRRENAEIRKENARARQDELRTKREEERRLREEERRLRQEEAENEKILRMEKKITGVMLDTALVRPEDTGRRDDVHEITYAEEEEIQQTDLYRVKPEENAFDIDKVRIRSAHQLTIEEAEDAWNGHSDVQEVNSRQTQAPVPEQHIRIHKEGVSEEVSATTTRQRPTAKMTATTGTSGADAQVQKDIAAAEKKIPKTYMFPPLSRLQKGVATTGDSTRELKETAMRLQQTLHTFGVKVTITDISQGPSVTRYELQPEQGVKVSKIVGLADDIKLNLAATDIRIEAPIPGKAAIGIEVPNKENSPVALRDLLESREFKEFPSNIAFAVGKDIAGKTIVADIAKMPHMLIAGATGSGKSVCINTLIMSILYKAHPDDVKLIMVDPKVVELSVYNGIPHLLIPVVTDPKKASAALHWGVSEMEDRYKKFAEFNVRDLKGYNKKVESMQESDPENAPKKLPQIVIIVDELADLMMVCPGEVEESICRLAQLARAAGIHLIIATQRPSVDVITGLIKANMPSRVAFSVSSGVDSRTILDMNGAEKLLGKGDMLFYPQGYTKPARIQGAFVSDKEVGDVVDFLKNQAIGNTYAEDIEEKIKSMGSAVSGGSASSGGGSQVDELFERAGRLIIDKDKASIGMLQRALQIGFNRAARIMDQLCEFGVVGEEEGTKPRKILMSPEQFEQLIEEVL